MVQNGSEQSSPRCDACAYWQAWGTVGLCRFNPPVQIRDVRNDMVERWPPVAPDDWCGQFKSAMANGNCREVGHGERQLPDRDQSISPYPADLEDEF
jgi:hypothetical protein